jgi:uncharacterized protein YkwD
MLATLFLLVALGQGSQSDQPQWFRLTNQPGWEGYGKLNGNGWVITTKFRRIDNRTVEVPPAIDPAAGQAVLAATTVATTTTMPVATTQPVTEVSTDPYGFLSWLNATRAAYGLSAVGHDPNLSSWAAENNNHQAARGMGHFVMGPARRQNAAYGSFANIGSMWLNSAGHRAALLDPTARWMGIAGLGAYWTLNLR